MGRVLLQQTKKPNFAHVEESTARIPGANNLVSTKLGQVRACCSCWQQVMKTKAFAVPESLGERRCGWSITAQAKVEKLTGVINRQTSLRGQS
jgi:hypothetical protein